MKGSPSQALKLRYSYLISLIDDPNCKRMLLDTRQMLAFEEAGEMQPHHLQLLRYPFDRFWVEFTEPLHLPSFEDGWYLRGFTITDNVKDIITIRDGKSYSPPNPAVSVMLYFTDDNNGIQTYQTMMKVQCLLKRAVPNHWKTGLGISGNMKASVCRWLKSCHGHWPTSCLKDYASFKCYHHARKGAGHKRKERYRSPGTL